MEESLSQKYSAGEVKKHIEPLEALASDDSLWNHTSNGLAVFSATGLFKIVGLPVSVDELAMEADSFHTKPLRQYMQSTDRYHVLDLSLHDIRLFEGNRHSLVEIELMPDIPKTITEALGNKLTDQHTTIASYGGTGGESSPMHHGQGGKTDETRKKIY